MTPYQKQLVEDYEYLINLVINRMHLEVSEYYGDGAVALCNAALVFNENKEIEDFIRYASVSIEHEIIKALEREKRYKRQLNLISISEIYDKESNTYIPVYEFLPTTYFLEKNIIFRVRICEAMRLISSREKEVLIKLFYGYTAAEIGEYLGISQSNVFKIKKKIKRKLKEIMNGD